MDADFVAVDAALGPRLEVRLVVFGSAAVVALVDRVLAAAVPVRRLPLAAVAVDATGSAALVSAADSLALRGRRVRVAVPLPDRLLPEDT